jgi:hypothetical protein
MFISAILCWFFHERKRLKDSRLALAQMEGASNQSWAQGNRRFASLPEKCLQHVFAVQAELVPLACTAIASWIATRAAQPSRHGCQINKVSASIRQAHEIASS